MTRNQRFRALFQPGIPFVCMGAFDAITAKLAEASGAQAIFVSGFVACGVEAGEPDMGALCRRDMFEHIRRVHRATSLPVFADADTGYGGMLDVQRTIRLWEEAGADGLYADAVESVEQMRELSRRLGPLGRPLLFNMVTSGKSPALSLKEVGELGFAFALCPVEPLLAMHKAVKEMMEAFYAAGCDTRAIADRLTSFKAYNEFVGLPEAIAREARFTNVSGDAGSPHA
jgi:2-methylisocitrate lyase-like PEP mutase family enzyme